MNTYLGISTELDAGDVDNAVAGGAGLLFLEGYLYDKPKGKAAFTEAARACRAGGGMAGISLSDPFCVEPSPRRFSQAGERARLCSGE